MNLFKKWSNYAFAYASMQMHNYPKPSDKDVLLTILPINVPINQCTNYDKLKCQLPRFYAILQLRTYFFLN